MDDELVAQRLVLVEYDGPQLILFNGRYGHHVGIAADHDEIVERWLLAPVSNMELEALALDGMSMREVFSRKSTLLVFDFDESGKVRVTNSIQVTDVPRGILPVHGASLPSASRELLRKHLKLKRLATRRRFRFSGRPIHGEQIEFAALAGVAQALQDLWTALGEALSIHQPHGADQVPSTMLLAGAASGGSFAIDVHAVDKEVFKRVLDRYRALARLDPTDPVAVAAALGEHSYLRDSFVGYLETLEDLKIDAFVEAPEGRVFVSHIGASLVRYALRPPKKRAQKTPVDPRVRTW